MKFVAYFLFFTAASALRCYNDEDLHFPEIKVPEDFQVSDYISPSTPFVEEDQVKIGGRIVNGLLAEEEKRIFPYQAFLILYHPSGKLLACGGSIITERWILTAAHCTYGYYYVSVGYGSNNFKKMTYQNSGVLITHPDYINNATTIKNDIGLIQLCKNLIFNEFVSAIKLPSEATCESFVGTNCTVSGFGGTEKNQSLVSEDLRFTTVEIISNIDGMRIFKYLAYRTLIFARGNNDSDTCLGDSGGALTMVDDKTKTPVCIGVVSFSKGECGKYPTAYTRVDMYLPWIRKYIFDIKP